ncbi:hypothetical protein BC332_28155 [Capsicum chinense]|nr:hypothetical protein BC332_28155 [Capsicum chinense]
MLNLFRTSVKKVYRTKAYPAGDSQEVNGHVTRAGWESEKCVLDLRLEAQTSQPQHGYHQYHKLQRFGLHVEVYSREPIFLREKLIGTTSVVLKEYLDKYDKNSEVSKSTEEVGSFQLRKKNSNKPQGFVDVSIRILVEKEEPSSQPVDEGFKFADNNSSFNLALANVFKLHICKLISDFMLMHLLKKRVHHDDARPIE